jgi:hypothetical protein
MVHHTVGVYINPLAPMKHNGVFSIMLQEHIEYNILRRPGRALIVDGQIVYKGCVSDETLKKALEKITTCTKPMKDTRPYQ